MTISSLHSLLIYFRNQVVSARGDRNAETLRDLESFNRVFLKFAYANEDVVLAKILESIEDSFRDTHHGVEWKSSIPTEEEISTLLAGSRRT